MIRVTAEILELTERIESLGTKQKVKLLERVLTPELELRGAMEQMAQRARHVPSRVLDRAVRAVRRERGSVPSPMEKASVQARRQIDQVLRQIARMTEKEQCELLEAMLLRQRRSDVGWGLIRRTRSKLPLRSEQQDHSSFEAVF